MKYNPKTHNRRSIRLKGYDYSQAGYYFVTICCQNRAHMFGKVINGKMKLNDAGLMIEKWYYKLESKFPDIKCGEMVVMPNHFHCIIHNIGVHGGTHVGAYDGTHDGAYGGTHVGAHDGTHDGAYGGTHVGADPRVHPSFPNGTVLDGNDGTVLDGNGGTVLGEHMGSPLRAIMQWFKTMSTNEYIRNVKSNNWKRFDGKLWQRDYWECIVRDEQSLHNITNYIRYNPKNWKKDTFK